jgi:putative ABC transport system substrate-binding protein
MARGESQIGVVPNLGKTMRRRDFITGIAGSAAAWPITAHGQQSTMPVIGFIRNSTEVGFGHLIAAFHKGLNEAGYVEGRNVMIEFRWANNDVERLPALAADLVSRQVAVIVANYGSMAAVMAATKTIPIVFSSGDDPVTGGLVANLNRPGGNITGVSFFDIPLSGKRLGLLHELLPEQRRIALLLDSKFVAADAELRELDTAAQAIGRQILVVKAASELEIESASATIAQSGAGALVVGAGSFFIRQRRRLVELAAQLAIPATYVQREFVVDGGLMSYGASQTDAYRRAGRFVGRVLKGEKPSDMPIELPTKFELVINLNTAKTLGLSLPPGVLAITDEVIE